MPLLALMLLLAATGPTQAPHIRPGGLSKVFPSTAPSRIVLSFLPSGSWGATDECAGVALTGTRGEALTLTRGSSAACTKTSGTVVTLTSNKPRLQGTGLLIEPAATNLAIRSEAFDNAAWTKTNVTVTADSTAAPDTNTTADTLQSTVNGGLAESTAAAIVAANATASVYVRTVSGTQSFDFKLRDTTGAADKCTTTNTATTTWTRYSCNGAITSGNSHSLRIYPGTTASTGTIVAWGAQMEAVNVLTSYVATAGTSVARSADVASLPLPAAMSSALGCAGARAFIPTVGTFPIILSFTNTRRPLLAQDFANVLESDNTANATVNSIDLRNSPGTFLAATWSTALNQMLPSAPRVPVTGVSSVYNNLMVAASTDVYLGSQAGTGSWMTGTIAEVQLGTTTTACQ